MTELISAARARPQRLAPPLRVAGLCLFAVVLASAVLRHENVITGDARFYERIASHPSGPHNFPYAYRIGLPWLVHVLPFAHVASFTVLAWLAIAAAGGAMYALLREFEIPERLALALSLGFVLSPNLLVVLLRDGRSVDPETILLLTLGTLFAVRRQRLALAITLLAGTAIHESSLFVIPLAYALWAERPLDLRAARELAVVCALPLALYVLIRTSIATAGPGLPGPFLHARLETIKLGLRGGTTQLRRIASAFGPLWLAAPLALPTLRFARRGVALLAVCLASMTVALDWGRIAFFAAPVIYVAAAWAVRDRRRLAVALVVLLFVLDLGYAVYMQTYGVAHGLDTPSSSNRVRLY
jgi:hypothetical protein